MALPGGMAIEISDQIRLYHEKTQYLEVSFRALVCQPRARWSINMNMNYHAPSMEISCILKIGILQSSIL